MRAVVVRQFVPVNSLIIEEVPDPVPAADEVVVDVVAADVNYPDILVIEGTYQIKPPLPFSPGKAAAGRISAVGARVEGLQVGDRVAAQVEYGAYAEKLRAQARSCFVMPEGMPFDKAAAMGLTYQTAWFALKERAHMKAGEVVLVLGASGGIGVASVQLAKAFGAQTVIAGVLGESNAAVAHQAGADHVIELSGQNLRETLKDTVGRLTDGRGADVVIDPVGGEANSAALRALAWRGRLVIVGFASGTIPTVKANYLLVKNISAVGLQWSDYRDRMPSLVADAQQEMFDLFQQGRIDPHISQRVPLQRVGEALLRLRDGKAQGKIVLEMLPS